MITEEQVDQKATEMRRLTCAIMTTIEQSEGAEDMVVVMGSIGAVLGAIALASGRPEQCLAATLGIARSFIQKGLLDSDE